MTVQEFKRYITRSRRLEKLFFYFISFVFITIGIACLYQAHFELSFITLFFLFLGSLSLYLIPNRYKVMIIDSNAPVEKKKKVIADTMNDLDAFFLDNPKQFWSFYYRRPRSTFEYKVYLAFDDNAIFASVLSRTSRRGGFIDFGQTEQFRKKLATIISEKINKE